MKRLVALLMALVPVAFVAAGLLIFLAPDVVTQEIEYRHSHITGVLLLFFAIIATFVSAMVIDLADLLK